MTVSFPYYYVRLKGSRIAHHWDYAKSRTDHALCGEPYFEVTWEGEERPRSVCRDCQALLPPHEARWWRQRAEVAERELEAIRLELQLARGHLKDLEHKNRALARLATEREIASQRRRRQEAQQQGRAGKKTAKRKPARNTAKKSPHRKPPRIQVVSGGAPGLGKRR